MRFVTIKTPEQQSCLILHRTRHLLIRQQTSVINAIRAHLAEFGIVAAVGRNGVEQLLGVVADANDKRLPEVAHACLAALGVQLRMLKAQILEFDRMINAWHRTNETSRRLDKAPGIGPVLATALVATVADPKTFRSGRNFSAWIGLVPQQHSSGGKDRLGHISKQGDRICAIYSWPALSPSSATPRSMARNIGPVGSWHCWRGDQPRSPPSYLPTRLPGWLGP
jgi:transposase